MMGRILASDRDRRHYRGRFPAVAVLDQVETDGVSGPRHRTISASGRDLVVLAGYGRCASSLAMALADAGLQSLAFERYATALEEVHRLGPELVLAGQARAAGDLFGFLSSVGSVEGPPVVILLAEHADPQLVDQALEHGAHDVLCPPHSVASILLRLRVSVQMQDRQKRARNLARRVSLGRLTLDLTARQVLDGGRPISLSGREFELLVRLMEAGGGVVSREDLLEDIWGSDQATPAVLDATVHRLRKKLDETFHEPDLVTTVRGVGYRLDSEDLGGDGAAAD